VENDSLNDVLRDVDVDVDLPNLDPHRYSSSAMQRRAQKQQRSRMVTAAGGVAALLAVSAAIGWGVLDGSPENLKKPNETMAENLSPAAGTKHVPVVAQSQLSQLEQMAALRQEIENRQEELALLLALEQQMQQTATLRKQLSQVQRRLASVPRVNETPGKLLILANRRSKNLKLADSAREDYRRIIDLYPKSQAATEAKIELASLDG
jgi:Tfp pilus assembly protein PilN